MRHLVRICGMPNLCRLLISCVTEPVLFPRLKLWRVLLLSLVFFVPPVFWIVGVTIDTVARFLTLGMFSFTESFAPILGGSGAGYLGGFYVLFLLILLGFLRLNRWCGRALEVPPGVRTDLQRWVPVILNVYFFGWILAIPVSLHRFAAELQTMVR